MQLLQAVFLRIDVTNTTVHLWWCPDIYVHNGVEALNYASVRLASTTTVSSRNIGS